MDIKKNNPQLPAVSHLETLIRAASKSNEYMPVYELFVNTAFFVPVLRNDDGPKTSDFRYVLRRSPVDDAPMLPIAESLDLLGDLSTGAIRMKGHEVITRIQPELGIFILLSEGAWGMPKDIVDWLRRSIQPA